MMRTISCLYYRPMKKFDGNQIKSEINSKPRLGT